MTGIVGYGFGFGGADNVEPTEAILQTTEAQRAALVEEEALLRFAICRCGP